MSAPQILSTNDALDAALAAADEAPVIVFKHSLTCSISRAAHARFLDFVEGHPDAASYFVVEVQNARPVSNTIAERTGVRHESPQALLLRGGEVVWHASHGGITQDALASALARV